MRKIFAMLAVVTLFWGCSKIDEVAQDYTLTGYSTTETRTDFGTPSETSIPFLWSEGDYVVVGGVKSSAIAEGGTSATFTVNGSAPVNGKTVYYNRSWSVRPQFANTAYVPAQQSIDKTLGENGDFGYATVKNGSFTLNHATSYFWFDVEALPDGYTLESIKLSAVGGMIAGYSEWNGSAFGEVDEGSSSIILDVNKTSVNGEMLAMVALPVNINSATVTYKLSKGGEKKSYRQTLGAKNLVSGKTYKVTINLAEVELSEYELRVLTFEDTDARFSPYYLDYADFWSCREIRTWSHLIDDPQYSGPLLYGNGYNGSGASDAAYAWYDEGNTELQHIFPDNGYSGMESYCFAAGGHAISNYWGAGYADDDRDNHIAKYYGWDYVNAFKGQQGADQFLGWFCVQLMTPVAPHSGENFAVHYGYKDDESYIENLPEWTFGDGESHVIDHMYITNTNYTLNQLYNGVKSEEGNTFGGNWIGLQDDAWLKIVAYGFESVDDEEPASEVEFYLVNGMNVVEDWQKWDLSGLGEVAKVRFNFLYSEAMGGMYGLTIPGYFAYDDVAVRF